MTSARTHTLAALAAALLLSSCGAGARDSAAGGAGEFPMTLDSCGEQITIDAPPERVLTGGTAVDLVVAAGGADLVVGRFAEFDQPLRGPARVVEDVPVLDEETGGYGDLSAEEIIATDVDLVIYDTMNEGLPELLAEAGIPSLRISGRCEGPSDHTDFADIFADIQRYGELFGTQDIAAASVADLRDVIAAAERQGEGRPSRTAAVIDLFEKVLSADGNRSMSHSQMEVLGLTNVFGDVDQVYTEASVEEFIDRDPDVLIISYGYTDGDTVKSFEQAKAEFLALPGVADMTAVRNDDIIGLLAREKEPGVAAIDGLASIATGLEGLS